MLFHLLFWRNVQVGRTTLTLNTKIALRAQRTPGKIFGLGRAAG